MSTSEPSPAPEHGPARKLSRLKRARDDATQHEQFAPTVSLDDSIVTNQPGSHSPTVSTSRVPHAGLKLVDHQQAIEGSEEADSKQHNDEDYWDEDDEYADFIIKKTKTDHQKQLVKPTAGNDESTLSANSAGEDAAEESEAAEEQQHKDSDADMQRLLRRQAQFDGLGKGAEPVVKPLSEPLEKLKAKAEAIKARSRGGSAKAKPADVPTNFTSLWDKLQKQIAGPTGSQVIAAQPAVQVAMQGPEAGAAMADAAPVEDDGLEFVDDDDNCDALLGEANPSASPNHEAAKAGLDLAKDDSSSHRSGADSDMEGEDMSDADGDAEVEDCSDAERSADSGPSADEDDGEGDEGNTADEQEEDTGRDVRRKAFKRRGKPQQLGSESPSGGPDSQLVEASRNQQDATTDSDPTCQETRNATQLLLAGARKALDAMKGPSKQQLEASKRFYEMEAELSDEDGEGGGQPAASDDETDDDDDDGRDLEDLIAKDEHEEGDEAALAALHRTWVEQQDKEALRKNAQAVLYGFRKPGDDFGVGGDPTLARLRRGLADEDDVAVAEALVDIDAYLGNSHAAALEDAGDEQRWLQEYKQRRALQEAQPAAEEAPTQLMGADERSRQVLELLQGSSSSNPAALQTDSGGAPTKGKGRTLCKARGSSFLRRTWSSARSSSVHVKTVAAGVGGGSSRSFVFGRDDSRAGPENLEPTNGSATFANLQQQLAAATRPSAATKAAHAPVLLALLDSVDSDKERANSAALGELF